MAKKERLLEQVCIFFFCLKNVKQVSRKLLIQEHFSDVLS